MSPVPNGFCMFFTLFFFNKRRLEHIKEITPPILDHWDTITYKFDMCWHQVWKSDLGFQFTPCCIGGVWFMGLQELVSVKCGGDCVFWGNTRRLMGSFCVIHQPSVQLRSHFCPTPEVQCLMILAGNYRSPVLSIYCTPSLSPVIIKYINKLLQKRGDKYRNMFRCSELHR